MCRFPYSLPGKALRGRYFRRVDTAFVLSIAALFLALAGDPVRADELQGPGGRTEQGVAGDVIESAPESTRPISVASRIGPLVGEGARAAIPVRRPADWTLWDQAGAGFVQVAATSADRGSGQTLATSHADVSMFYWREAVLAALLVVCVLVALLACTRNDDRHRSRHF